MNPKKIIFNKIEKEKYFIEYFMVPKKYVARIKAKTKIPGVNEILESELYYFNNFNEIEIFFKNLTES